MKITPITVLAAQSKNYNNTKQDIEAWAHTDWHHKYPFKIHNNMQLVHDKGCELKPDIFLPCHKCLASKFHNAGKAFTTKDNAALE